MFFRVLRKTRAPWFVLHGPIVKKFDGFISARRLKYFCGRIWSNLVELTRRCLTLKFQHRTLKERRGLQKFDVARLQGRSGENKLLKFAR